MTLSRKSTWLFSGYRVEVEEFQRKGKKLFPVKVRSCEIPEDLRELQVVDATENRERAYFRLKRGIEGALKNQ